MTPVRTTYNLYTRRRGKCDPSGRANTRNQKWKFQSAHDAPRPAMSAGFTHQSKFPTDEFQVVCPDMRMVHFSEAWDGTN